MARTRLLYFSPNAVAVYRWRAGVLTEEARFEQSDAGLAKFAVYADKLGSGVMHVLVDVVEEGFHIDTIPFVRGNDRKALLQRRLAQRFRDTTLATSISLGFEKTQRREERVLLSAFTEAAGIRPWLEALEHAEVPVSGVYSPALLAHELASRLKINKPRLLIVGMHRSGVRQSYVNGGRIHFSRLNPLSSEDTANPEAISAALERETDRLYQYLCSTHQLGDEPVNAVVLAPRGQTARMQGFSVSTAQLLRLEVIDSGLAAKQVGLKSAPESLGVEALYLHLLAKKRPAQRYGSEITRVRYSMRNLQIGLVAAGALVGLACVFAATLQLLHGIDLRKAITADEERRLAADTAHAMITRGFPPLPTTLESLRTVLDQYRTLKAVDTDPKSFAVRISRALDRAPRVELERLTWRLEIAGGTSKEIAEIDAKVAGIAATDYRTLRDTIDSLSRDLETRRGLKILAAELPFDISAEKRVSSEVSEKALEQPTRFTLTLTSEAR